jgi:hypothetical protein
MMSQPALQDLRDQIECSCLNDAGPDGLAPADADVDYALESEGVAAEDSAIDRNDTSGRRTGQTPQVVWRWAVTREEGVAEDVKEALKPPVGSEYFSDARGCGSEVGEGGEVVEYRQVTARV